MTSVPHSGAKSVTPGGSVDGVTPGSWHIDGDTVVSFDGAIVVWELNSNDADAALITAAPDFLLSAQSLLEAWDARTTGAQQIITGKSDRDLQKQAAEALEGLRAAIAKATAGETRNAEPIHRRDGDEG